MTIRNTSIIQWHRDEETPSPLKTVLLVPGRYAVGGGCLTSVAVRSPKCGWVIVSGTLAPTEITHWALMPDPPRELTDRTTKQGS